MEGTALNAINYFSLLVTIGEFCNRKENYLICSSNLL